MQLLRLMDPISHGKMAKKGISKAFLLSAVTNSQSWNSVIWPFLRLKWLKFLSRWTFLKILDWLIHSFKKLSDFERVSRASRPSVPRVELWIKKKNTFQFLTRCKTLLLLQIKTIISLFLSHFFSFHIKLVEPMKRDQKFLLESLVLVWHFTWFNLSLFFLNHSSAK